MNETLSLAAKTIGTSLMPVNAFDGITEISFNPKVLKCPAMR